MKRSRIAWLLLPITIAIAIALGWASCPHEIDAPAGEAIDARERGSRGAAPGAHGWSAQSDHPALSRATSRMSLSAPDASTEDPTEHLRRVLCEPRARILCEASLRCGCHERIEECLGNVTDQCVRGNSADTPIDDALVPACLEVYRASAGLCLPRVHCYHQGLPMGLGESCLRYAQSTPCAHGRGFCDGQTCRPYVEPGGSCGSWTACGPADTCRRGRCVPWDGEGTECEHDGECGGTLPCIDGRCRMPGGEGAACTRAVECLPLHRCDNGACRAVTSCARDADCGARSRCRGDRVRSTCVPLRREGEPCAEGECAEGLFCAPRGECARLAGRDEECVAIACVPGLACVSGRCGPPPRRGQSCDSDRVCAPGLRCVLSPFQPTCQSTGAVGERCAPGDACVDGAFCEDGRCVAHRECGWGCPAAHQCIDDTCVALRRLGEPGCAEIGCVAPAVCSADRCVAPPSLGEPCLDRCAPTSTCETVYEGGRCVADACGSLF